MKKMGIVYCWSLLFFNCFDSYAQTTRIDTRVLINAKLAGPVHQGGYYRFK